MTVTQLPQDLFSLSFWLPRMGLDLERAASQPEHPVIFRNSKVKVNRRFLRNQLGEGARPGIQVTDGRLVIVDAGEEGGDLLAGEEEGFVDLGLTAGQRELLPPGEELFGMVVRRSDFLELRPMRVEEHPADLLGPRILDELRSGGDGEAAPLVRHVVAGFTYEQWTDARIEELTELLCSGPLRLDPVAALAAGDDWVGWQTRREILDEPQPSDGELGRRLVEEAFAEQGADGSWDQSLVRTAYGMLRARSLGIEPDDERLQRAADWLLARPEPDGRPGMWMLSARCLEQWQQLRAGDLAREGLCMGPHYGIEIEGKKDETAFVRADAQQQIWPTCARHFTGLCDHMLHPSAIAAEALCACGLAEHPRVRAWANTMLEVAAMYGYFCACWGIDDLERDIESKPDAGPDFSYSKEPLDVALTAFPLRYARDLEDLCSLSHEPNWPDLRREHLADINGEFPLHWGVLDHPDCYALIGSYWQNADCWARVNRVLARLPGYPGTTISFYGQFQCHLYQDATGAWGQGFPGGNLRQIAEMAAQALAGNSDAPELRLARRMVILSVPWLREHQGDDGLWDHSQLPRWGWGEAWPAPAARTASYHIVSVLHAFGLLSRLRP